MKRLYVVVRADLEPGAQLAQACHAVSTFAVDYPVAHEEWQRGEQNLVVLQVPDELALRNLIGRAADAQIARYCGFHEPDFGNALTSAAFDDSVARLVSQLPLALRAPRAA
jgi:peptidyl-tRNA hydrolase PTH2